MFECHHFRELVFMAHRKINQFFLKNRFGLLTSQRDEVCDLLPLSQSQVLPCLECLEFLLLFEQNRSLLWKRLLS